MQTGLTREMLLAGGGDITDHPDPYNQMLMLVTQWAHPCPIRTEAEVNSGGNIKRGQTSQKSTRRFHEGHPCQRMAQAQRKQKE